MILLNLILFRSLKSLILPTLFLNNIFNFYNRKQKRCLQRTLLQMLLMKHLNLFLQFFVCKKQDNNVRLIVILRNLNSFVVYHHFKMETIQSVLKMITPNCWRASIDHKDACYSVNIHPAYQTYLKFTYDTALYALSAYPNGLASCRR